MGLSDVPSLRGNTEAAFSEELTFSCVFFFFLIFEKERTY